MNNPKHQRCLSSAKVGDVLFITVSSDKCMSKKIGHTQAVEAFPIVDMCGKGNYKLFIVISHYNNQCISACGTLVRIQKKR